MLAILLESTETRCILSWMRMNLRGIRCGSLCFKFPRHLCAGSDAEKLETETVEARLLSLPQPTIEPRHPQHG